MSQSTASPATVQPPKKQRICDRVSDRDKRIITNITHTIVLILSVALIVYISYDTFMGIPFLHNHKYMTFQLWVCVAFQLDFFIELILAKDKKKYFKRRWFFLLISIPYLNIVDKLTIYFPEPVLYYLRFIPLIRGAYSLAMVMGYISKNRALSLLTQYTAILLALVYMLALLFFYEEHNLNPDVRSFWDALYFSAMNTTTVGCYFSAITPVGKIISVICPTAGMLMLPLFTVFVTSSVQKFDLFNGALSMPSDQATPESTPAQSTDTTTATPS